jgi:hypothetical protein
MRLLAPGSLIVLQTRSMHDQIDTLFDRLMPAQTGKYVSLSRLTRAFNRRPSYAASLNVWMTSSVISMQVLRPGQARKRDVHAQA